MRRRRDVGGSIPFCGAPSPGVFVRPLSCSPRSLRTSCLLSVAFAYSGLEALPRMRLLAAAPLLLLFQVATPSEGCQAIEPPSPDRAGAPVTSGPPVVDAPATDEEVDPRLVTIFSGWDTDSDGVVTGAEYEAPGGGPSHYDTNKDGVLTLGEYAAYFGAPAAPATKERDEPAGAHQFPEVLPPGEYACLHVYYDYASSRTMQDPLGTLTLLPGGRYRPPGGAEGQYTYDPRGGSIKWGAGTFGGHPVVESMAEWQGDDLMVKVSIQISVDNVMTYRCYTVGRRTVSRVFAQRRPERRRGPRRGQGGTAWRGRVRMHNEGMELNTATQGGERPNKLRLTRGG